MRRTQPDFSSVLPTVVLPPFLASQTSGAERRGTLRVLMVLILLGAPGTNPSINRSKQTEYDVAGHPAAAEPHRA